MRKLILAVALIYAAMVAPASAHTHNTHALGNMYTKALNMIEAAGMLNSLSPERHIGITNIHVDHGQVFIALTDGNGPTTVIYDPIANKIVYGSGGEPATP